MVLWLVAAPIVILLLALAGANWKTFHLAYAKHLMSSDDPDKQFKGGRMVLRTHLRDGMPLEEVRGLLAPFRVTRRPFNYESPRLRTFVLSAGEGSQKDVGVLFFDQNDRLVVSGELLRF